MKKAGLYDQYRYPNKHNLSTDTVSTQQSTKGSLVGSAYRAPSSGRGTPVQYGPSYHQPMNKIPNSTSGASTFEVHDDVDLLPRRRRVSYLGWGAFGLQLFSMLLAVAVFLGPGWGKSKRDARSEVERTYVHNYHGLWLLCTQQALGRKTSCINNLYVDKEAWWISIQVMGCTFLVLTFACLLLISFYVFRIKSNRKWTLSLTHAVVSILNCLVMASCIILFAINFTDHSWWCCPNGHRITESILYWAWYLAIVALISQLISLSMSIAETCKLRT